MRTLIPSLLIVLVPLAASANEITTSTADVDFSGATKLYRGDEYRFTWPDISTDPIVYIELKATTDSELKFDMESQSELTWPTVLTQGWKGVSNGGALDLESDLDLSVKLWFDEWGYTFNYEIWGKEMAWTGLKSFDSLLLPGSPMTSATVAIDPTDIFFFDTDEYFLSDDPSSFLYNISVSLAGDIKPDSQVSLTGLKVRTEGQDITDASQTIQIEAPESNTGTMNVESTWEGDVNAKFSLNLTPSIEICEYDWLGSCMELPYTFKWDMATDARTLKSKPSSYTHHLPAIALGQNTIDMGEVFIGESVTKEIAVKDLGQIELWGEAALEGEGFALAQPDISAIPGSDDKMVITFEPDAEGAFTGSLTITTNDPTKPVVVVPISGEGVEREIDDTDPGADDTGDVPDLGSAKGCGCASNTAPSTFGVFGLAALGLVLRRKR